MNKQIENKIKELFESTPDNIGVMFGKKIKNGQYTNEDSIIFTVEKKKPLSELSESEILPSEIEINDIIYKTDVFESGIIEIFSCPTNIINNCYGWQTIPPQNRQTIRPLKGGISLTSQSKQGTVGTLGFLALDSATGALVGVTNNHVVISDAFYTEFRNLNGIIENEINDNAYQTGDFQPSPLSLKIGEVLRYVPLLDSPNYNQVDGAIVSISQSIFSNSESFKQFGLSFTNILPFATTSEINSLIGNTQASSSGRTSGGKEGPICGLTIQSSSFTVFVSGYKQQGIQKSVLFNNCISFTRQNPQCPYPIAPGDSGSALLANINGVTKIVGLAFAGSTTLGIACRIDFVSEQLGISSWDGNNPKIVDLSSKKLVTLPGKSLQKTIICNGETLWQVGLFKGIVNCPQPTQSIAISDPTLKIFYQSNSPSFFAPTPTSGSSFTQWYDSSVNVNNANTIYDKSGHSPEWWGNVQNGLGGVYFNGTTDGLNVDPLTDLTSKSGQTVIMVVKSLNPTYTGQYIQGGGYGNTGLEETYLRQSGSTYNLAVGGGFATGGVVDTNPHILTYVFSGSAVGNSDRLKFYKDGDQQTLTFITNIGTTTSSLLDYLFLGVSYTVSGNTQFFYNGFLLDVLIYSRALSPSEINTVQNYLSNKWNISIT